MTGATPHILIVHEDRKAQRTLHRILGSTLCSVDAVDNLAQAQQVIDRHVPALVVVDHALAGPSFGDGFARKAAELGTKACLVLMDGAANADVPGLFSHGSLTNLLTNPMPVLAEELTATALKLLRGDLFGLEKYLAWGITPVTVDLANAADRSEVVERMGQAVREYGLGPRVASLATLVGDELLSNAIYNAPVGESGARNRQDEARHSPRQLTGRDAVRLQYACDARYFAIGVTDNYGSLNRATIVDHLAKCANRTASDKVDFQSTGAGMGIGLVYSCCNHLVFNIDPGNKTEVIGLFDVRFKPAELGRVVASFNLFVERGGA